MDTSKIRTEKDLLAHLKAQQQELDELQHELSERRAESASRRLDLAEHKIQRLSEQGLDYGDAFEQVISELEAEDGKARAKSEQAQRERVETELEELTPQEEQAILELGDRDDDNNN